MAPAPYVNSKSARVKISIPRLHLPNLWRWSLVVKMTYITIFGCCNSTSPMDDVIVMSLGLYSNVWLGLIIIGTQVVEGLT